MISHTHTHTSACPGHHSQLCVCVSLAVGLVLLSFFYVHNGAMLAAQGQLKPCEREKHLQASNLDRPWFWSLRRTNQLLHLRHERNMFSYYISLSVWQHRQVGNQMSLTHENHFVCDQMVTSPETACGLKHLRMGLLCFTCFSNTC